MIFLNLFGSHELPFQEIQGRKELWGHSAEEACTCYGFDYILTVATDQIGEACSLVLKLDPLVHCHQAQY